MRRSLRRQGRPGLVPLGSAPSVGAAAAAGGRRRRCTPVLNVARVSAGAAWASASSTRPRGPSVASAGTTHCTACHRSLATSHNLTRLSALSLPAAAARLCAAQTFPLLFSASSASPTGTGACSPSGGESRVAYSYGLTEGIRLTEIRVSRGSHRPASRPGSHSSPSRYPVAQPGRDAAVCVCRCRSSWWGWSCGPWTRSPSPRHS